MKSFLEIINHSSIIPIILITKNGKIEGGHFVVNGKFFIIATRNCDWEHVSVSIISEKRCPTWKEMCLIKDIFFKEEETVVQYHPAKKNYINIYNYCLHLWKPILGDIPVPPKSLV